MNAISPSTTMVTKDSQNCQTDPLWSTGPGPVVTILAFTAQTRLSRPSTVERPREGPPLGCQAPPSSGRSTIRKGATANKLHVSHRGQSNRFPVTSPSTLTLPVDRSKHLNAMSPDATSADRPRVPVTSPMSSCLLPMFEFRVAFGEATAQAESLTDGWGVCFATRIDPPRILVGHGIPRG